MSAEDGDSGPGRREVAYRLFAAEFEDADFSYAESDEERAPNYVVTPTGARVNRLFVVGVLTEVEPVGEDVLRARVVDPTGAFVVYAGQYQPDAQTFLERAQPPAFVAVSGKARTFQPEDSDVIYTSIRPESVNEVDAETRDRWTVGTAEQTLQRIGVAAAALRDDARGDELHEALLTAGVDDALAAGVPLAIDHYGTTGGYLAALRELSLDAARVVAGDLDEVEALSLAPDQGGSGDLAALASIDLDVPATESTTPEPEAPEPAAVSGDSRAGSAEADSTAAADTGGSADASATEASTDSSAVDESATESPAVSEPETDAATESSGAASAPESESETDATTAPPDVETSTPEPETSEPASGRDAASQSADEDDLGDFEPGEFDLDEEVREEVEDEFGTEFQSGTEVEEPGEADIETPDPEDQDTVAEEGAPSEAADAEPAPESSGAPAGDESPEPDASAATSDAVTETPDTAEPAGADEPEDGAGEEPPADVDLEDAVMDAMSDLDDGDGADREAIVSAVVEEYGADPEAVEDAIQDALMDGRCYEPDDSTLKPI